MVLPAPQRARAGFSAIEIMLVVVIVGILAGIAVPRIDVARFQVESAIQSVGTTFLAAQREAVTRQHDVVVAIDAPARQLTLHFDLNGNGLVDTGERTRAVTLDESVEFGRGAAPARDFGGATVNFARTVRGLPAVVFHRSGSASISGGLYLTSRRAAGGNALHAHDTRALEIVRGTGRAEWWRFVDGGWRRGF